MERFGTEAEEPAETEVSFCLSGLTGANKLSGQTVYLSYAMLTLRNPRYPELPPVQVEALADTGSVHLCLPASVAEALRLEERDRQSVTIADGSRRTVPYVGPVEMRFGNRIGFGGALVLGDQVLLGALPLADMDLVVIPRERRVTVNPNSPDMASSIVKPVAGQPAV